MNDRREIRPRGLAFRRPTVRTLQPHELGDVQYQLAAAQREVAEIRRVLAEWQRSTRFEPEIRMDPDDSHVFEYWLHSSKVIPHRELFRLAGRAINEARSVLDNLNMLMFEQFAQGPYDENHIAFPITTSGKEWRKWKQKHRALPEWTIERYKHLQPNSGPFRGLIGLQAMDNARKHKHPIPVGVAILGEMKSWTMTVDGLLDSEPDLSPIFEHTANVLQPEMRSLRFAKVSIAHAIRDFNLDGENQKINFDLLLSFHDESYTLTEVQDLMKRLASAIDYVSTGNPQALARYQARPDIVESALPTRAAQW